MNTAKLLLPLSLFVLVLLGCKKEDEIPGDPYAANIAPCELTEEQFVIDEIIYGPSVRFPNATMRITFENSTLEYAFNKVPETGMYHMVTQMDITPPFVENQMSTIVDSGSYALRSALTDFPVVYIENYNNELIISYCDIGTGSADFDPTLVSYVGNFPSSRKVRMSY